MNGLGFDVCLGREKTSVAEMLVALGSSFSRVNQSFVSSRFKVDDSQQIEFIKRKKVDTAT